MRYSISSEASTKLFKHIAYLAGWSCAARFITAFKYNNNMVLNKFKKCILVAAKTAKSSRHSKLNMLYAVETILFI